MSLSAHLLHFGLSDKEVRVYIAALELGPSPVQVIARKAGVNRATTYVQIANLNGHGLMSSFDKGKKRYYVAESPERLAALYEDEVQHLREKEAVLREIMPELKRMRPSEGMPAVRLFEGQEGLETVRQELLRSSNKYFRDFCGAEHCIRSIPEVSRNKQFNRVRESGIKGRVIISAKELERFHKGPPPPHLDRRQIPGDKYDVPGELGVFDDKIVMFSYRGDPVAVVVESKELAQVMAALFDLAWESVRNGKPV